MIVTASSRPVVLSLGERTPSPKARCSSSAEPPPRPRISLPPESRSSVSAILAIIGGGGDGMPRAPGAGRVPGVAPAAQQSNSPPSLVGARPPGGAGGGTTTQPPAAPPTAA